MLAHHEVLGPRKIEIIDPWPPYHTQKEPRTMRHNPRLARRLILAVLALVIVGVSAERAAAQTVDRNDVLYIMPFLTNYPGGEPAAIAELRARLAPNGEGVYVKLGFARYIFVSMNDWTVDVTNPTAVRAAIAGSIADLDSVVAMGRAGGFPVSLAILDAVKEAYDPVQRASEAEDIRSMQWYADNVLAPGWWSYSRYARKRYVVQQAYMREVGREVAKLMRDNPDTLVAASGDGEVELARPTQTALADQIYADFSPFTVAEFRDWVRLGGLYAPGGELAGQGYAFGARYAGDLTPNDDTNGDGHTFNADFGTAFTTWNLLHFDWSLADQFMGNDPHAISLATYSAPGFNKTPAQIPGGFDPPRAPRATGTNPFWDLWVSFKQTLIQHYNVEFAKWMTTTPAPPSGGAPAYTIPRERWYSYQIPADAMFLCPTCSNPNERWYSSMSSWWTADISPYGSSGITAFNVDWIDPGSRIIARTLLYAAPKIADRNLRWGVIEWHPGLLKLDTGVSTDPTLFSSEMDLVKKYRPSLLQPFMWGLASSEVMGNQFEVALRNLVTAIKDPVPPVLVIDAPIDGARVAQPFSITGWAVDLNKGPGNGTGFDRVDLYANPASGAAPIFLGSANYGVARPDVAALYRPQYTNAGFSLAIQNLPLGQYEIEARGHSSVTGSFTVTTEAAVTVVSFAGPTDGGGWSGTVSGSNLIYNGVSYPIVNGRVNFPDCTTYIVAGNGSLMGGSATPNCTPGVPTPTTPTITWANPVSVVAGTTLGATQLNAAASVAGTFAYSPTAGTVLAVGTQTLSTTFTPANTTLYTTATSSVTIIVTAPITPTITWANPASVAAGTVLGATQLNATASVPGTFVYSPAAGTVLASGTRTLATTFTPTDSLNYTTATKSVTIVVAAPVTPTITWANPASVMAGTALGATQLNATANVPGTFVYTPAAGTVLSTGTQTLATTFTPTDTISYTTATATANMLVTTPTTPVLTWATPASVVAGTALGATQLNASANVPGTFAYSPTAGAVLAAGTQTLATTFTPTDTANYTTATKTVSLVVTPNGGGGPTAPTITWANPSSVIAGTALGATQLNATANVPGTFVYTPAAGTVLSAGTQTLAATFTPTNTTNYTTATKLVTMVVTATGVPAITWANPASVVAGTALGATQLNATANVPGTFIYTPAAGTVLAVGTQTLATTFTPADTTNYTTATKLVTMVVTSPRITPTLTWATPASVSVGTALSVTQLNASSGSVAGTFVYVPPAGTMMNAAGNQTLSVTFTPTDAATYASATASVTLAVTAIPPFVGPANGGGWSGTISGSNLTYRNGTYPIVNGRVNFPDCTTYIVGPNGSLMGGSATPNCTPGGGGSLITPTITWPTPVSVAVGTALSGTQLNASSGGIAGSLVYTPPAGTAMNTAGNQILSVTFTPTDGATYASATASVTLVVTASGGGGSFVGPANGGGWSGTISGSNLLYRNGTYPIVNGRVNFPDCTTYIVGPNGSLMGGSATPNCTPGSGGGPITPTIIWNTPSSVSVGTVLSATQLNASSGGVAGTLVYTPPAGTAMNAAGNQTLLVTFTPADGATYVSASASVVLAVTASGGGGGGSFVGPANGGGWSGTISGSNLIYRNGTYPIVNGRVSFPDCTTYIVGPNGALMGGSPTPNCTPSGGGGPITPTIVWNTPAPVTVGTVLSGAQLNASSGGVAGSYFYTPAAGTAMNTAGNQTLSVTFTPTDGVTYASASASVTLAVTASGGGGGGSSFVGPANGGGWSGTISGSNLVYNSGTYPIVNGRVNFPDCTTYIVGPNGALMGGSPTPNCTPSGSGGPFTPTITWSTPAPVAVGTVLSGAQLTASSGGIAGSLVYTPPAGTAMNAAGNQILSVTFTPTDGATYTSATASVTLVVTATGGGGFVGPANGGGWSGTISGANLVYNGRTFTIVNGRVNFPDCTTFIVAPNGALMGGSVTPNCTPGGGA